MRARDLVDFTYRQPDMAPPLPHALEDIAGQPGSLPDARTLGRHLRDAKHRNFRGLMLHQVPDPKHGHRWRVDPMRPTATYGANASPEVSTRRSVPFVTKHPV